METGLEFRNVTQQQLEAIPGIGRKGAWRLISHRAKSASKGVTNESLESVFEKSGVPMPPLAKGVLSSDA